MSLLLLLRQDDGSVFVTVALVIVMLHSCWSSCYLITPQKGLIIKVFCLPIYSFAPNVIFPSARNGGAKQERE